MPRSRRYSRRRRSRRMSRRMKRPRTAYKRRRAPLRSGGFYSTRGKNELKFFDTVQDGVLTKADPTKPFRVDSTGTQWSQHLVFSPILGSDAYMRIGRQVNIRKIVMKGVLYSSPYSAAGHARVMLVYDAQTNATAFTLAQLLKPGSSAETYIDSIQNLDNRDRFKILMDKQYLLAKYTVPDTAGTPDVNIGTSGPYMKYIKIHKKVRLPVVFNNNSTAPAGSVGDITTGSLYCLIFHNKLSNDNNALAYNFQWRVRYYDS